MPDSTRTGDAGMDQGPQNRTDLARTLAVAISRRRDAVESRDPAVRYRATRKAWEEATGDRSGIATREQIKLLATAAAIARRNDQEIDRTVGEVLAASVIPPEYRDVRSPAGTVAAVEVGGIVVVRNDPLRILAGAFSNYALRNGSAGLKRAMRSAWRVLRDHERMELIAAVDRPRTTAARVARACGLHWRQMVSSRSLLEEIVREGTRVDGVRPPSLEKLRKLRFRELPRGKRVNDYDDDWEDEAYWPDDYRLELEAEDQADFEDRCALADNLSGMSPNELD